MRAGISASAEAEGATVTASVPGAAKNELRELADELRQAAINVAWRQWRVLGASAVSRAKSRGKQSHESVRGLVDPEALVLLSLALIDSEKRFADVLHDWTARNSELLSVQRIKNLADGYPSSVQNDIRVRLAWFARVALTAGKDLRWRSLANGTDADLRGPARSQIESMDAYLRGARVSTGSATSAIPKSRAVRARLADPPALLLRLRRAFGVGVKADIIGYLLGRAGEWVTVRDLGDATAYTPAAIRRAAEDLTAAQFIQSREDQPASYRADRAPWMKLLDLREPPPWRSWNARFTFVVAFLAWADFADDRPLSAYAFGTNGRELLERHRAAFDSDSISVWSAHTTVSDWGVFVSRSVRALVNWMIEAA